MVYGGISLVAIPIEPEEARADATRTPLTHGGVIGDARTSARSQSLYW